MAYNLELAQRVRERLTLCPQLAERKMFGGLCFLSRGNMLCGLLGDDLVIRCSPEKAQALLARPHVRPMDFTGKPMKGFLIIGRAALEADNDLRQWLALSINYVSAMPAKLPKPKPKPKSEPKPEPKPKPKPKTKIKREAAAAAAKPAAVAKSKSKPHQTDSPPKAKLKTKPKPRPKTRT